MFLKHNGKEGCGRNGTQDRIWKGWTFFRWVPTTVGLWSRSAWGWVMVVGGGLQEPKLPKALDHSTPPFWISYISSARKKTLHFFTTNHIYKFFRSVRNFKGIVLVHSSLFKEEETDPERRGCVWNAKGPGPGSDAHLKSHSPMFPSCVIWGTLSAFVVPASPATA